MVSKTKSRLTALVAIPAVALLFMGLGVFLDGEVLPPEPNTEKIIEQAKQQANNELEQSEVSASGHASSEYLDQLSKAIDSANDSEHDDYAQLERQTVVVNEYMEEINQVMDIGSSLEKDELRSDRLDKLNRDLDGLQKKLSVLEASE
jgi:hypothetical protein